MISSILPAKHTSLSEATSIALVQQLQYQPIQTPLRPEPITTTYSQHGSLEGDRSPLLLLHGFDSSFLEFRRLVPRLATTQSVWVIDLLGFGFTERPAPISINPDTIRTHLYCSWQTLIDQPVSLVGVSMGGAVALDFALTYPDLVQQLILIDSAGATAGPALGRFLFPPLGFLATEFLRNSYIRQQISCNAYFDPKYSNTDAQLCGALHLDCPRWREALISFTRSGGYPSFLAKLKQLSVPTLILWGEQDQILGTQDATTLQKAIPGSQLRWISQCGHVPHLEQPDITAQFILEFIEDISSQLSPSSVNQL